MTDRALECAERARHDVHCSGAALVRDATPDDLAAVLRAFGHVIHVEDVASESDSGSLVSSRHGLSPHTDHHAAHHIVWYCRQQADKGGDSILVDGLALVQALPERHRQALGSVRLAEHNIFVGDLDEHPMLWVVDGEMRLYYSYWLARADLVGAEREAFNTFARALEVVPLRRIRLRPRDLLVVNNHRMLHGRSPITGATPRLLVRHWLAPEPVGVQKVISAEHT